MIFSQSVSQLPSVVSTCENPKPSLSDDVHLLSSSVMETEPEHGNKQKKTVLLNTTMEMTLSNATDIVVVETKAKKTGRSGKPKGKKKKEHACGSSVAESPQMKDSADSGMSEVQSAPTGTLLHTDDDALEAIKDPHIIELQAPKTQRRSVTTSRIPKLKSEAGNHQKMAKDKFKSCDPTKSETESCGIVLPDLDDFFMDPARAIESVKLSPEKDIAEEARSKITCRRSRTKGRRMSSVIRKTFVTLPSHESESSQSKLEQVHNEVEKEVKEIYETCKDQELSEELLFCADEVTHPASEHVGNKPQSKVKTATNSVGSHKSRCRGTFFVSVARTSTSSNIASSEVGAIEQDLLPFIGASCEAQEPATVTDERVLQQDSESNPHRTKLEKQSCKRPWLATQDSESPQEGWSSNDNDEVLALDQGCTLGTEFHKPKKARKEETSRSSKKKAVEREKCVGHLNDRKKNKKSSCAKTGFRSEDEACYLVDPVDASPLHGLGGADRNKEELGDLQMVDSHSDIFEHLYDSKPNETKSRMDWNAKRRTSKLHTPTETRNPRETFVVYMQKDNVTLNDTRTSNVSDAHSHMVDTTDEAVHQNLGGLLTDEMPPWLAIDVSTADTEVDSVLATPRREMSGRAAVIEESAAITTEASPGMVSIIVSFSIKCLPRCTLKLQQR